MLIPRFTLRWLLALTTVCAGLSLVLSFAFRGEHWAIGISVGVASLLFLFALHAGAFCVVWLLAQVSSGLSSPSPPPVGETPFASESPFAPASSSANPPAHPPAP